MILPLTGTPVRLTLRGGVVRYKVFVGIEAGWLYFRGDFLVHPRQIVSLSFMEK